MLKRMIQGGVAVIASLLVFAMLPTAYADDLAEQPMSDSQSVAENARLLQAYAEFAGISVEDAQVRVTQEDAVHRGLMEAGLDSSTDRADVWLDSSRGELALHVRSMDDEVLKDLSFIAQNAGLPIVAEHENPLLVVRTEQVSALGGKLAKAIPGLMGHYVDPETGALVLDVYGPSTEKAVTDRSSETRPLAEGITGFPVVINVLESALTDTSSVYGGVALNAGGHSCTAGFTATFTSGGTSSQGFVTAAHCAAPMRYSYGTTLSGTLGTATYQTQLYGSYSDVAFFSIQFGDQSLNRFYGSSASTPTTQSYAVSAAPGATVCGRGSASSYGCGTVKSTTYQPDYAGACPGSCSANFAMTNHTAQPGDSGGPLWTGSASPVGILKGGGSGITIYSKIGYLPAGVSLK